MHETAAVATHSSLQDTYTALRHQGRLRLRAVLVGVGARQPRPRYRVACIVAILRLRRVGVTVVHTARLLRVVLACSDALAKTVFVDPPYQRAGQDGGRFYCQVYQDKRYHARVHGVESLVDYDELERECGALAEGGAQVIVCEGIDRHSRKFTAGWGREFGWREARLGGKRLVGRGTKELVAVL